MYYLIDFTEMGDSRGTLVAIEGGVHVPFPLKRVFYVYGTKGEVPRGCHANRKTKFVLVSVKGRCTVTIKQGMDNVDFVLDSPTRGLFLDRMVWKEMHSFSDDAVLLVLCSEPYDKNEYVFNYAEYLLEVKNESHV
ncbi:sugar 3,4-ketoisomerase [Mixta tenebrionis]|uniref:WxcM-like domain-containing protein n=1 Tax=Mixta tenebrionis TaxID=2562439 RepID=A0A506V9U0_9GAMM|nr:FdtA/QdtA family cupin domain-containing protein [Mixta tenebrionis]TPW42497.1 WxcM-like domain-containing protein [Mixta tenebrionis]